MNANFKLDKLKKVAGIFEHGHIKDLLFDLFFLTDPIKSRVNTNVVENITYQPNLNYIHNNILSQGNENKTLSAHQLIYNIIDKTRQKLYTVIDTAFPSYSNKSVLFSSTQDDSLVKNYHTRLRLMDVFHIAYPPYDNKSAVFSSKKKDTLTRNYDSNKQGIMDAFYTADLSYGNKNIVFSSTKSDSLAKSYHSKLRRMDIVQAAYSKNTMNLNKLGKRNNLNAGNDDMIKKVYFDRKILKKRELRNTYLSDFYQNTMTDFLHSVVVGKKINNKKFNVGSFTNNINKIADQAPTLSGYVIIEKQKYGSKNEYFLESNNVYNLKKKSFVSQYKEGMTHKNYLNKIKKDFINLTNSNNSTAIGNKENCTIKEGLEQVVVMNKKPIQIAVNVSKFQDSINIHTYNLQESTTKVEEKISQVFVKILKDAAKVGRQI